MPPILRGAVKTRDPGLRVLAGSFTPEATPVVKGKGFTVTKEATGHFRVTLATFLQAFHSVVLTVKCATPKNLIATGGPILQTSKYFDIYLLANGVLTDGAATDGVSFIVAGRNISR